MSSRNTGVNVSPILFLIASIFQSAFAAQPASPYDFEKLLQFAKIANSAYHELDHIKKITNQYSFKFTHSSASKNTQVRFIIITDDKNKHQIISVRGTSNIDNVLVDVTYELIEDEFLGVKLHQGFAQSSQDIFNELKTHLNKDYVINTTGHSLGGAIAVILAMYLHKNDYKVGEVITFGQPKVTNRSGVNKYDHLNLTRVVTEKDMVPIVPPFDTSQIMSFKMDIFWHFGKEIIIYPKQYFSILSGMDSLLRGIDFLNEQPSEENIRAHYMATYIEYLEQKVSPLGSPENETKVQALEIPYDKRHEYLPEKPKTINKDSGV